MRRYPDIKYRCMVIILLCSGLASPAQEKYGAATGFTTLEAEDMRTTGTVLGPGYDPYRVETESSGQRCVKLASSGQLIEFTSPAMANTMVIRYDLPDNTGGTGTSSTLGIYINGKAVRQCNISSRLSHLYGKYPFTNNPADGTQRNFYDETRIKDLVIHKGDVVRVQRDDRPGDDAGYCIIDLVDLEKIGPPLQPPTHSLSITDSRFKTGGPPGDYTEALRNCITRAAATGMTVWIPPGVYKITGDIILPANVTIRGAGMWYSQLVGDTALYADAGRRVRLKGNGSNIHLSDLAIVGALNYRNDKEANDGIVGSFGENSTISRVWIEHTKVGMWIENSRGLKITGCRMRNTIADGINFCVGMAASTIENCSARGTGDDCFAIWPTVRDTQKYKPGHNRIAYCTATLPFLANGAAIYGGESNEIANCSFRDITPGSAILISTTFPTESREKSIDNNFSGRTLVESCEISTSGGFDHEWGWRAAIEICLDKRSIAGLRIDNMHIDSCLSNGLSVIAKNEPGKTGILTGAFLQNIHFGSVGIGTKDSHMLFISPEAHGSLTVKGSAIPDIVNASKDFSIGR
jgi:Pectate lyase superfamily protein